MKSEAPRPRVWYAAAFLFAVTSTLYEMAMFQSLVFFFGDSLLGPILLFAPFVVALAITASRTDVGEQTFARAQLLLGIAGTLSILVLVFLYAVLAAESRGSFSGILSVLLWVIAIAAQTGLGFLVGSHVPLLKRSVPSGPHTPTTMLGYGYLGLFASILGFPLWLFPQLGIFRTVFLAAGMNAYLAARTRAEHPTKNRRVLMTASALFAAVALGFLMSRGLESSIDRIVYGAN